MNVYISKLEKSRKANLKGIETTMNVFLYFKIRKEQEG